MQQLVVGKLEACVLVVLWELGRMELDDTNT